MIHINKIEYSLFRNVRNDNISEFLTENLARVWYNSVIKQGVLISDRKGDLKEATTHKKCEIKAYQIIKKLGPTSFGPNEDWDMIIFLGFIYNIKNKYNTKIKFDLVNKSMSEFKNLKVSKNQTFEDQQKQGRRPRQIVDNILKHFNKSDIITREYLLKDLIKELK